jgi:hypothetical protein
MPQEDHRDRSGTLGLWSFPEKLRLTTKSQKHAYLEPSGLVDASVPNFCPQPIFLARSLAVLEQIPTESPPEYRLPLQHGWLEVNSDPGTELAQDAL